MATAKLKKHFYYDWYDIKKRFGFKNIEDVFIYTDFTNGSIQRITNDLIKNAKEYDNDQRYKNQLRILNDIGECDIHVWW